MRKYFIERWVAGAWKAVAEVEPVYRILRRRGRVLFWREYVWISQLGDAEALARRDALTMARKLAYWSKVRVICVTKDQAGKNTATVAEIPQTRLGRAVDRFRFRKS